MKGFSLGKRHRSRLGILLDILKSIRELDEAPITSIITYANVPHDRLKRILERLVEGGYIKRMRRDNRVMYVLMPKGLELIRELEKIKDMLEGLGLAI